MTVSRRLRGIISDADDPRSLAARARRRRFETFHRIFPDLQDLSVLDLGGTQRHWTSGAVRPRHVTVLNLENEETVSVPWIDVVLGDACDPHASVYAEKYDLVYSNSLLEHVGGYARRRELADLVRRAGRGYWVQTPYRYFPIEPHLLFPGFQFLPLPARAYLKHTWPMGWRRSAPENAVGDALEIELVGKTELRYLFPEAEIAFERFAGLPKSLYAWYRSS